MRLQQAKEISSSHKKSTKTLLMTDLYLLIYLFLVRVPDGATFILLYAKVTG